MIKSPGGGSDVTPGAILLIGIGQSLRGDDAAGLEAVRLWQARYQVGGLHKDVQVELVELPGMELLGLLQGARYALIVDAVQSGALAGTLHILSPDQLRAFPREASSAHGFGVEEALALGEKLMPSLMPGELALLGIEVANTGLGQQLSPEVAEVLPKAASLIEQLITQARPGIRT